MKTKKHKIKIDIPEGMEVKREVWPHSDNSTCIIEFEPIQKPLPKTWGEFLKETNRCYPIINHIRLPLQYNEAFEALGQLIELRDVYNDGWEPDWMCESSKYVIYYNCGCIAIANVTSESHVLAFRNFKLRDEFCSNFAELIKTAKPLL